MKGVKRNQFVWGGIHPFLYHPIVFSFIPNLVGKVIVDCGCGKGVWGYLIRTTRDLSESELIGVDLNTQYLKFCRRFNVYDKLLKKDIKKLPFKNKSVDFLICSEVIEHMKKKDGYAFLAEVDRVMKPGGRVVVTSPNTTMDTVIKDGIDAHRSYWTVADFRQASYKVYGVGIKLSTEFDKWYARVVLGLGYAVSPITYFFPEFAGFLISIKDY